MLSLPTDSLVVSTTLLEAAKSRFFLQIRDKWHRVRIEQVPTGLATFENVVKSSDVLISAVLREMRSQGLLEQIEVLAN